MSHQPASINLIVQNGPNPGQVFRIQARSQTIGRGSSSDIVINDQLLAQEHARITPTGSGFVIQDLGSKNGTYLNGMPVLKPTFLRHGDTVQLGETITVSVRADQANPDYIETTVPEATWAGQNWPTPPDRLPPPLAGANHLPQSSSRSILFGLGIGAVVTLLIVAALSALLYYSNSIAGPSLRQATQMPKAEVSQIEPTLTPTLSPTPSPMPTATSTPLPSPSPTQEVIAEVSGIPAAAAEERQPLQDAGSTIDPFCNGEIEVKANEPIRIQWQQRLAEPDETDYSTQWLENVFYDVRLDDMPATDWGPLYFYRDHSCGDDGHCGSTLNWWINVGLQELGLHRLTMEWYTRRAVSDGFDQDPVDGRPDVYGPGHAGSGFCNILVEEIPSPTPSPTSTPAPTSTPPPAYGPGIFLDFEDAGSWRRGDQPYGEFNRSADQVHSGNFAGKLTYDFPQVSNDFVDFRQPRLLAGQPSSISAWVYGDKSGNLLNIWIQDREGEIWSVSFGEIQHDGWQQMSARIDENQTWPSGHIRGPSNGKIDYPISFFGVVLDNIPDASGGRGTIYVDDLESRQ